MKPPSPISDCNERRISETRLDLSGKG